VSPSQPVCAPVVLPESVMPNDPSAHVLHAVKPAPSEYSFDPSQLLHVSTLVELADELGLKAPGLHGVHTGWDVAVPTAVVACPAAHVVWAVHVSVAVELTEADGLKLPAAHASHTGCDVVDPATVVECPAAQVVCAVHVSVAVELTEADGLKLPAEQSAHSGMAVEVPATVV
jgi:hypothetical protein